MWNNLEQYRTILNYVEQSGIMRNNLELYWNKYVIHRLYYKVLFVVYSVYKIIFVIFALLIIFVVFEFMYFFTVLNNFVHIFFTIMNYYTSVKFSILIYLFIR